MTMDSIKNPAVLRQQEEDRNWIEGLLVSAQKRRWFGTMTIEVKNGLVSLIRNEETLKPPKVGD